MSVSDWGGNRSWNPVCLGWEEARPVVEEGGRGGQRGPGCVVCACPLGRDKEGDGSPSPSEPSWVLTRPQQATACSQPPESDLTLRRGRFGLKAPLALE